MLIAWSHLLLAVLLSPTMMRVGKRQPSLLLSSVLSTQSSPMADGWHPKVTSQLVIAAEPTPV